jgi:hypothetical protein
MKKTVKDATNKKPNDENLLNHRKMIIDTLFARRISFCSNLAWDSIVMYCPGS